MEVSLFLMWIGLCSEMTDLRASRGSSPDLTWPSKEPQSGECCWDTWWWWAWSLQWRGCTQRLWLVKRRAPAPRRWWWPSHSDLKNKHKSRLTSIESVGRGAAPICGTVIIINRGDKKTHIFSVFFIIGFWKKFYIGKQPFSASSDSFSTLSQVVKIHLLLS